MACPLPLCAQAEDREQYGFDICECARCQGHVIRAEVCAECGLCQVCREMADDCTCEIHAYDRYIEADYQEWEDARYG